MRLTPMPCTLKEYRQEALTGGRYSNQCTGALHFPASRMVGPRTTLKSLCTVAPEEPRGTVPRIPEIGRAQHTLR